MKKTLFTGAGVALVTPFSKDGSIDYDMLGKIIDFQIEGGTDALIILGTTGEGSTVLFNERIECFDFSVRRAAGKVPVIAGSGSNSTDYTIQLAKAAESVGVDAHLVVTPYYNKTSQRGLVKHYFTVADSTEKPIIIYNVPSRTGLNIKPETYKELSKHDNIIAVKEANGNLSEMVKTRMLCGDDLDIYVGNDDQVTVSAAIGAKGVISVLSNIMPKYTHDMAMYGVNGDIKKCAEMQMHILPVVDALFCDVNPIPVKDIMRALGADCGDLRLPLCSMSDEQLDRALKSIAPFRQEILAELSKI
ncbi:MAG: 4-hydroxy-tetrahydrodipicolinate synthase [Clostridia bacterium]|nr:4-hydroxy-tetrahydrodipicolinate synthase [Clostridia bacterium]